MVREVIGDLLENRSDIICHQTNYAGIMGAGVALAIKSKLLTQEQYEEYQNFCDMYGSGALGLVQFIQVRDGRYVANLFSQSEFLSQSNTFTDYEALEKALRTVEIFAREHKLTVALPGRIGCGIAGGSWDRVLSIIMKVFKPSPVLCTVCYKESVM